MYKYLPVYVLSATKSYEWEQKLHPYSKYASLYPCSMIMYAEKHILHRIMCIWDIHTLTCIFPHFSQPHWKPRRLVSPKQTTSLRGNGADSVVWLLGTCIKLHTSYTKNLLTVKEIVLFVIKQEITLVLKKKELKSNLKHHSKVNIIYSWCLRKPVITVKKKQKNSRFLSNQLLKSLKLPGITAYSLVP